MPPSVVGTPSTDIGDRFRQTQDNRGSTLERSARRPEACTFRPRRASVQDYRPVASRRKVSGVGLHHVRRGAAGVGRARDRPARTARPRTAGCGPRPSGPGAVGQDRGEGRVQRAERRAVQRAGGVSGKDRLRSSVCTTSSMIRVSMKSSIVDGPRGVMIT